MPLSESFLNDLGGIGAMTKDIESFGGREMRGIDFLSPVMPYELNREDHRRYENLIERISAHAVVQGRGHDLLLYIYLAGFYHGVTIQQERMGG